MTTKQIRSNNSPLPLRLKIASGYILLIVLLGMIVFVVWNGNQQVISLNAAERIVQEKRTIINRIFEQLLNLSFGDDLLLSGDTAALALVTGTLGAVPETPADIAPRKAATVPAGFHATYDAIILPGAYADGQLAVDFTTDGGETFT